MKLFVFAVLLTLYGVGLAAMMEGYLTDPAHPGKCVVEGLVLSPGERGKPKGHCIEVGCGEDNYGVVVSCGIEVPLPPCYFGDYIDVDAPFGECCARHLICP